MANVCVISMLKKKSNHLTWIYDLYSVCSRWSTAISFFDSYILLSVSKFISDSLRFGNEFNISELVFLECLWSFTSFLISDVNSGQILL